jgi:SAM-dependent methyltransferase
MESMTHSWRPSKVALDGGKYMIDLPTRTGFHEVSAEGALQLNGWAFVDVGLAVPSEIFLELFSKRTRVVQWIKAERCERKDVSTHFCDPGLTYAGFNARIGIEEMYGEYGVRVYQVDDDHAYRSEELVELRIALQEYEKTVREGLAKKFLRGHGLEIGALQRKLSVSPECRVTYVDRMSLEKLLQHYPEMARFDLQRPDIIADGETLGTILRESQDFVIANHFLEHCQNPIQTIENLLRVLKVGGTLYMAVPDKRYTFDHSRRLTTYAALEDTRRRGRRADIEDLYTEWAREVQHTSEESVPQLAKQLSSERYSIHFNVWTLDNLINFLLRAREDFGLPFEVAAIVSGDNEVVFVLTKNLEHAC